MLRGIKEENYDVLSLDIFDTLLLRTVAKPVDIFPLIWEKAKREKLNHSDLTGQEFLKLRVEMERRARRKSESKEITLKEIYDGLPVYVVRDKKRMEELELEVEKEFCYLNPLILRLIRQFKEKGKKVVLLSDMYLISGQIKEILLYNGFCLDWVEDCIVSCEYGCNKQNGLLYQILLKKFPQIEKNRILHIGDNLSGDYQQALNAGIQAVYYDAIPDKLKSIYDYEKMRHHVPQPILLSLRKLAVSSNSYSDAKQQKAFEIGASILGPFLTLYISHVAARMKENNMNRIYPLMREGWLLGELLKKECQDRNLDYIVKPVYTSRKVSFLSAIEKVDREVIENIIGVRNITVGELLAVLELNQQQFQEFQNYFDTPLKISHTILFGDKNLKEAVIEKLLEEENVQKIESDMKSFRQLYIGYLLQEMGSFIHAATIDIGCFGRIQEWTQKALELEKIPYELKHFFGIGTTGERVFNGIDIEGYYSTYTENLDLITTIQRTPDVLEKLISITEGSTIGYKKEKNRIVPVKGPSVKNDTYSQIVFDGIFAFQKLWFYFRKNKPELASKVMSSRRDTLKIFHRLIDMPSKSEVEFLMDFEADTNFGTDHKASIIREQDKELMEAKGVEFVDRCNISFTYQDSNIVWPKGLITLKDEFYYVRRNLKNNAGNETMKAMQEVVEKAVKDGVEKIALYGAGETGRQFFFVCEMYGLPVHCFVDRKESLWGTLKEGIPVMGLKQAIEEKNEKFIVTSLFSIDEIRAFIEESFRQEDGQPVIYCV